MERMDSWSSSLALFAAYVVMAFPDGIGVRMERVENLLCNPFCKIDAIAATCGWSSPAALRTIFKRRHNGLSMSEWRERYSNAIRA